MNPLDKELDELVARLKKEKRAVVEEAMVHLKRADEVMQKLTDSGINFRLEMPVTRGVFQFTDVRVTSNYYFEL